MIAVPAHRAGDVQGDLREEGQQCRDFVADHLGGVIVAVVHQGDALIPVHGGVAQGKFRAAYGIALHADAEHLALHAGLDLIEVKGLGENFVDGLLVAQPGAQPVGGDVLEAVARPDVHGTDLPQLLRQILRDAHAGPAVLDPEAAGFLVGGTERQRITLRVGEEGGVKVRAEAVLFAEVHPRCKMLRLQLIAVDPLALGKNSIAGVEIQLLRAGAQLQHLLDIRHQLLRGPRAAGIAAGGLDAAGKGLGGVGVETAHIVPLPAVQRQRHSFQLCKRRFGIHTEGSVFFFCFRIAHRSASICIFRLPRAVASMGRAMTCLPVALAVRWFKNSFFAPPPTMYSLSYCFPVFRSSCARAFA